MVRIFFVTTSGSSRRLIVLSYDFDIFWPSVPGIFDDVPRAERVRVRYQDAFGKTHEEEFDGLLGVCLQHEMDHLNGEFFFNKANRYHREKALTKWRKGDISAIHINTGALT